MIYITVQWGVNVREAIDFKRLPTARWKQHQKFRPKSGLGKKRDRWHDIQIKKYCKVFRDDYNKAHVVFL